METVRSNRIFCFGDGVEVRAIKTVKFPVTIGSIRGIRGYIEADIVKNDVPLLLSHKSMKTAGILLNFKNDSCCIFGRHIKLQTTTSRHYSLPLTNILLEIKNAPSIVLHCETLKGCCRVEKRRKAAKLHRQFAHASK